MTFQKGDIIVRSNENYPEGALVVDGFDPTRNLLAHPLGGGLQLIIPPSDIPRFGIVEELEMTRVFRRSYFSIEGVEEQFEGWSDGRHWNGWAMPHFEFQQAQRVVAAFDPENGHYNASTDSFVTRTSDGDEESWLGETIALPDGGEVKVYPVGTGSWIWDEEDSIWG